MTSFMARNKSLLINIFLTLKNRWHLYLDGVVRGFYDIPLILRWKQQPVISSPPLFMGKPCLSTQAFSSGA